MNLKVWIGRHNFNGGAGFEKKFPKICHLIWNMNDEKFARLQLQNGKILYMRNCI